MIGVLEQSYEEIKKMGSDVNHRKVDEVLVITQAITILQNESDEAKEIVNTNKFKIEELKVQLLIYLK
ncbi:hypothetical protein LCGC14_2981320 [marine sediment metagenome]|uniref:Uncharacterized protein n=1 Tax=marine sediment metagenome TaxID=412755 RepID=A0A0F8X7D4_9ZZZZ